VIPSPPVPHLLPKKKKENMIEINFIERKIRIQKYKMYFYTFSAVASFSGIFSFFTNCSLYGLNNS